jgi:hypothetical protein
MLRERVIVQKEWSWRTQTKAEACPQEAVQEGSVFFGTRRKNIRMSVSKKERKSCFYYFIAYRLRMLNTC